MTTTVVNRRHHITYDVYVGRGSKWGNPFSHLSPSRVRKGTIQVATREEAIESYIEWADDQLTADPTWLDPLRGKVLACWCRPMDGFEGKLLCHAQVLAAMCDDIEPEDVD